MSYKMLLSITKLQNLKAIHNWPGAISSLAPCCYQSQNYKIWKQFTTPLPLTCSLDKMLSITKLQNLKAIHNKQKFKVFISGDVINHKTTKFESNSQPLLLLPPSISRCYQSQNYKIWKQFTTLEVGQWETNLMLSITKLQNLKAIHNTLTITRIVHSDVINHKTTKFESNSQL